MLCFSQRDRPENQKRHAPYFRSVRLYVQKCFQWSVLDCVHVHMLLLGRTKEGGEGVHMGCQGNQQIKTRHANWNLAASPFRDDAQDLLHTVALNSQHRPER